MKKHFSAGAIIVALAAVPAPASAMNIVVTYDGSVGDAMKTAFNAVVSQYDAAITNNITAYVYVSAGSINGTTLATNDVGESATTTYTVGNYAMLKSGLQSQYAATGFSATLAATDPTNGKTFVMPAAEARALASTGAAFTGQNFYTGAAGANPGYDAYLGFSNTLSFSYSNASGTPAGQYDFKGVAEHELDEALGKDSELDGSGATSSFLAEPLDAFRYTAPGVTSYSLTPASQVYASVDGGKTSLGTFADAAHNGGDPSDWYSPINSTSTDSQDGILVPGVTYGPSTSDAIVLAALGYTIDPASTLFSASNAPLGATPTPAPEPASLAILASGAAGAAMIRRRRRRPARR